MTNQSFSSRKLMWPRQFSLRALLAMTAAVALILALWPRSLSLTRTHFNLLKTGMEQSEVEKLYGPPRNEVQRAIVWVRQEDGRQVSTEIPPGSLKIDFFRDAKNKGHQAVWLTKTGLVAVNFGKDGKLQHKYFSTVHVLGPPLVLDWLAIQESPAKP